MMIGSSVKLCALGTGKQVLELLAVEQKGPMVTYGVLAPDGKTLAVGFMDGTLRWWDVTTRRERPPPAGHSQQVNSLAFTPDSRTLATGNHDQTVKLWDVASGRLCATLRGHTTRVNAVAFSPDDTMLASGSHDRAVRLWHAPRQEMAVPK